MEMINLKKKKMNLLANEQEKLHRNAKYLLYLCGKI